MSDATRKLATIVALDVAGYSARTEADEAKTTTEVAALRKVIEAIATRHGGRVFNTAGDGFMLEFGSSLAAVEAALELAETCEPKVRVGVHLGDVAVQPNGDLLGHGVNVAARLMAQSAPGAALVSGAVRQSIRGPIAERLQSRGTFKLDKMAETIEAFALASSIVFAVAQSNPAEPVLAVLPFDNLSDDRELQFFSDGVSEEILQVLARGSGLKVIGRTSAFQFRGARKGEAARMLKATHILDGAVRKAGARLRVSAQLTETGGGAALWSERYDRDLTDVFAVQDDVAAKVAESLRAVLQPVLRERQINPRAYELYLKSMKDRLMATTEALRSSEVLLEQTVALAPEFANGWALLGAVRTALLPNDQDLITPQYNAALAATQRALALDPNCAVAYSNLLNLRPAFAEHAQKIEFARRAKELAPNDPLALAATGVLMVVGRCRDNVEDVLRACTLEPMSAFLTAATARRLAALGRHQEAHALLDEAVNVQGPTPWTAHSKFAILFDASRFAEADAYIDASLLGRDAETSQWLRFLLGLPTLPDEQRRTFFQDLLGSPRHKDLSLTECGLAARFGCADLAFDHLFAALESKRVIVASHLNTVGLSRAVTLGALFFPGGAALRTDRRFPAFCNRVGLIDYWRTSGHWPDCADQVPYDFKAECEAAARDVAQR